MIDFQGNQTKLEAGDIIIYEQTTKCFMIFAHDKSSGRGYDKKSSLETDEIENSKSVSDNKFFASFLKEESDFTELVLILAEMSGLLAKVVPDQERLTYEFFERLGVKRYS